jgi:PAS domain S-box-containing protein
MGFEPLPKDGHRGASLARAPASVPAIGADPAESMALIDALPQIVWTCEADGSNEVTNRRWAEYTGVEEPSPQVRHALLHPDDRERTLLLWRRALGAGEPYEADFRLRRRDGAWRWQLARALPVRGGDGRVLRWFGTITDIEAQFRAVHESAIDGFMVLRSVRDAGGRVVDFVWVYCNEAAARIVGRPRGWFSGRSLLAEMPGNRDEGLFDAYVDVVDSGRTWSRELVYTHEGLELDLRIVATRADDGIAVSFADLSERRRAEQQLRRLQARQAFLLALGDRLRSLTDPHEAMQAAAGMLGQHLRAARCGYAELDEGGEYVHLAPGWDDGTLPEARGRHRLGDPGGALLGQLRAGHVLRLDDVLDDPRLGRCAAESDAARSGVRASLAAPLVKAGRLVALLYVHEPRPRRWTEDEMQLVREVAERTWSSSERARAVRALRQSEARMRLATEGVGLGIWEADVITHDARWSESQFRIFGLAPTADGQVPGGTFSARLHPEDLAPVLAAAAQARATGGVFRPEYRITRADTGELRWVAAFGRVIQQAGGGDRFVGITLDITERKRLEAEREGLLESERAARSAAEAATRAKDEFLATLSHELRTPLSVIISWSRLLQRRFEAADPDLRRGLKVIMDNAFAQSQLITDLLDMSRIVSGKLTLDVRPVDLWQVVVDAVDGQAPTAQGRGIELALRPSVATLPAWVRAEAGRLHQVLGNLLSNALKFTPSGGRIEVALAPLEAGYEVSVRDSGEGIAPDFLPHLFDRFRQADAGAARRHGGLGLGLSVVRQLVEMHGGTVHAHSDGPGRGATFSIRLPALDPAALGEGAGAAGQGAAEILEAGALAGLRVLAVEDEPSMRAYIARVLEEYGAQVVAVESAAGAVEQLRATLAGTAAGRALGPVAGPVADDGADARAPDAFDLLVSDIGLPGTDGYALMRLVRESLGLGPERLGALALTAFAREVDRARCLEAGYQAHLSKPYQVAQLVGVLRQLAAPRAPRPAAQGTAPA